MLDIRRQPRLSITFRRQNRHIVVLHLHDQLHTAATTARVNGENHNCAISSQTVRNRLEVVLRARRPQRVFKLSDKHYAARLA